MIDDERAVQEAMRSLLSSWGYAVVVAGSAAEMARRLRDRPARPDLIICDYRLRDGENGIEVIDDLRRRYDHPVAALLVTGDTAPDRLNEARASGLVLLHKPVSNSKLRAAVGNLMRGAGA